MSNAKKENINKQLKAKEIAKQRWIAAYNIAVNKMNVITQELNNRVIANPNKSTFAFGFDSEFNKENVKVYEFVMKQFGFKRGRKKQKFFRKDKIYYCITDQGVVFGFKSYAQKVKKVKENNFNS